MRSVHMVLRGRVQGVGFRAFVVRRAHEYGVHGEVRNTGDGAVELTAEGDDERVEAFLDAVREGPLHARVEHVDLRELQPGRPRSGFSISG